MAGVTNREFWDFRVKTRAQFTKLAEQIANIDTSGGGGVLELTSKMVVDALGYTPYNANNPANYITSAALAPYALKADIPSLVGYATEDFVNNKLQNYTTTEDLVENYASKSDLESAINDIDLSIYLKTEDAEDTYATKDFVTTKLLDYAPLTSVQGFENRIGGLEGAVPQLNKRVATVEGKVSSLNETVSTGENNLLDRVNTIETDYVTSGKLESAINGIDLSVYLLKADLTKSRIQSTLGISDWALAATKPSYAWSEITSRPTALSQFTDDVVTGKYLPLSKFQVAEVADPSTVYLQSGIYRQSDGSHLAVGTSGWSQFITLFAGGDNWAQMYFSYDGRLHYRVATFEGGDPANIPWTAIITEKNIGNYNAGSATKLQTPRTLWGQSFDGTAKIGGDITLNALQDGRQLSIQQSGEIKFSTPPDNGWVTGLSIYANDKTTLLTSAFGVHGLREDVLYAFIGGTYDNPNVVVQDDTGYVGIGTINPEERLHVNGTIKSGNLSVSNQIGVKTIVGKGFGLYSSDTNPYLELNQNGKFVYLQMMGDNGMVALGSTASKSLVVNAAGFVSVNRGYVNPTEALDVGGNILASGNINATSITINGVTITASNGSITVNGNVFATGDITGGV